MRVDVIRVVIACLTVLAGCSMGGTYSHPTKSTADLQRDVDACNEYASRVFKGWAFSEYTALIDQCLERQYGWKKVDQAQVNFLRKLDALHKEIKANE